MPSKGVEPAIRLVTSVAAAPSKDHTLPAQKSAKRYRPAKKGELPRYRVPPVTAQLGPVWEEYWYTGKA